MRLSSAYQYVYDPAQDADGGAGAYGQEKQGDGAGDESVGEGFTGDGPGLPVNCMTR
ncbi:hypothetical protein AGMMS49944_01870 [Spirochaetia bacterium]|nr:hypothetical protein AGMMS49944_01870 [Spirochaetia bacterium]